MAYDKTIQLLIFDGNPNGRIKCELSNWDGRVYKLSRTELNKFSSRSDANYTGVYFLSPKTTITTILSMSEKRKKSILV